MKELKKLTKRELTRIRAIQQISHHIAHIVNIILRNYPNNERYRGRNQLRLVLDNIDRRLEICELKFQKGIRMYIQFGDDDYIRNKLFLIIDKDGDYSIDIYANSVNSLIDTRDDILELLLDLIHNRRYTYIKPVIAKEHAIMHYGDSILNSIECNKFSDMNYNRLKCNNPKYVCEDKEMGAIIYPDLKAAYVEESKVFIGEDLK